MSGVRGKLSSGASGWRMSYRNSGIMGTVNEKEEERENVLNVDRMLSIKLILHVFVITMLHVYILTI